MALCCVKNGTIYVKNGTCVKNGTLRVSSRLALLGENQPWLACWCYVKNGTFTWWPSFFT